VQWLLHPSGHRFGWHGHVAKKIKPAEIEQQAVKVIASHFTDIDPGSYRSHRFSVV
jgi:hypothetical protein